MEFTKIIHKFEELSDVDFAENMKRFGIQYVKSYGLRLPQIRKIAKQCGRNHALALKLWNHGYHETYLLATLVEEPEKVDSGFGASGSHFCGAACTRECCPFKARSRAFLRNGT